MKSRFVHRLRYIEDMNISEDIWKKWSLEMQQGKEFIRVGQQTFVDVEEADKWLRKKSETKQRCRTTSR